MFLQNRVNKKELKKRLEQEAFKRITISFYRYVIIENPQEFRDELFKQWQALNIFGRIYVAHEGINAQMSVPEENWEVFHLIIEQGHHYRYYGKQVDKVWRDIIGNRALKISDYNLVLFSTSMRFTLSGQKSCSTLLSLNS